MNKRDIRRAIKEARKAMETALKKGDMLEYIRREAEIDFLEYRLLNL